MLCKLHLHVRCVIDVAKFLLILYLILLTVMSFSTVLQYGLYSLDDSSTDELSWRFYRGSLSREGTLPTYLPSVISSTIRFELISSRRFPELSLYLSSRLQEPKYYRGRIYFVDGMYLYMLNVLSYQLLKSPLFQCDAPIYALGKKLSDIAIESMLVKEAMIYDATVVTVYIIHGRYKTAHQMLAPIDIIGVSFHGLDNALRDAILISLDYIPNCYGISDCEYAIVNHTVVIYPIGEFWVDIYTRKIMYSIVLVRFNSFGQITGVSTISLPYNVEKMSEDVVSNVTPVRRARVSPRVPVVFKGRLISVLKDVILELHIMEKEVSYSLKEISFQFSSYHMLAYDGVLYVISGNYILKLDENISIVERIKLKAPLEIDFCRFTIDGNSIYVLARDYLAKFSMENGDLIWRVKTIPGKHLIQSASPMLLEEMILCNDSILVSIFSLPFEGIIAISSSNGTPKYYYSIDCIAGAIAINGVIYAIATPSIKQGVEFNALYILK